MEAPVAAAAATAAAAAGVRPEYVLTRRHGPGAAAGNRVTTAPPLPPDLTRRKLRRRQQRRRWRECGRQDQRTEARWRESNEKTGNSEEGGHVDIQIEMGPEYCVGTRQASTVGYNSRFSRQRERGKQSARSG